MEIMGENRMSRSGDLMKGLHIKYLQQHLPSEHLLNNTPQARQSIQENSL
jgi:hypothetical protein